MALATGSSVLASGLGLVSAAPAGADGAVFTVESSADDGAVGTLRWAIDQANATEGPDVIDFDLGLAGDTITLTSMLPTIVEGLAIEGLGSDQLTVLGGSGFATHRVFYLSGAGDVTISGLALTGRTGSPAANGGQPLSKGGAIRSMNTDLVLDDVAISNSVAHTGGGVAAAGGGSLEIRSSVVSGNRSGYLGSRGAGLYAKELDAVTIQDSEISGNLAGGSYGGGGGLYAKTVATVDVIGSTFEANSGLNGAGGATVLGNGAVTVEGTTFTGNLTSVAHGVTAMMVSSASTFTVDGSTFADNHGPGFGTLVAASTVAHIENTTVAGNSNSQGPAVLSVASTTQIQHSTITGNRGGTGQFSQETGGVVSTYHSTLALENSIVSGSTTGGDDLAASDIATSLSGTMTASFSLIGDAGTVEVTEADGNLLAVDPMLGELALNGGTTLNRLPEEDSPAVDAGDPAFDAPLATDQRGLARESGTRTDMGAVEVEQAAPPVAPEPVVTPPTTTPPTTTPPTTTPPQPPPAAAPPAAGGGVPMIVVNGTLVPVPLPASAPPQARLLAIAMSPTESLAISPGGQVYVTNPAHDFGQIPATMRLNAAIVGLGLHYTFVPSSGSADVKAAADSAGEWVPSGYWMLGADGGVFSFGTATFHGSTGAQKLNKPVVALTPTPTGNGYWLVAADGGVFSFGDAKFSGSAGAINLVKPVVGMVPTATGKGYWLIASDGGVFAYGDAAFFGSAAGTKKTFTGAMRSEGGAGYWLVAADGTRTPFGDAR